jgi:thiaminase
VESVSRTLDPSADLSKALARLEQKISIHAAMKKGFTSLYGYASDENGIRHALLEAGEAKVDEADALFMIGACAAFVSYLLNKARTNGSFVRGKLVACYVLLVD